MKKNVVAGSLIAFLFAATSVASSPVWINSARANLATHIIINEIQTADASGNDEFIELFNPADTPIDLEGYKLSKKTKTGSSESPLVSTAKFLGVIPARGYFLIAHPNYKDKISADLAYSGSTYSVSNDNTVFLYNKEGALLDKVGFGSASEFEGNPASNPDAGQSIERTNFVDTDDNSADFSANTSPSPQNSSVIESNGEELPGSEEIPEATEDNEEISPAYSDSCATVSGEIRLNEILPSPSAGDEFVEIKNIGESCVDISGWKIMDEAGHKIGFPGNSILDPGEYFFLEGNLFLNNDSDTVYILDKAGNVKNDAVDSKSYEKAPKDSSYSFDGTNWNWTSTLTPGNENIFDVAEDEEDNKNSSAGSETADATTSENIYLNEILPNPEDDSDNEYIEIANGESGPVDLFGWKIKDASRSKGYKFADHVLIGPGEYLAIYKSQSKLALNNSEETIYLHNPQGDVLSSAAYDKLQKGASFNFDGKEWRWSKYLTPGKKNKFDFPPSVRIKKAKNVFKDIPIEFYAKAKDKETKKLKYSWDFGDGKKSYLAKTSHKYLDTGKYTVTLSVSDDSQTIEKKFTIAVKNYSYPKLEILKISPNPVGNDSESETIDLKNNSGKKVSLNGWKIATGSGENLYNHPIGENVEINPGETKAINRDMSKFSLNNKAGKVQLVAPDGEATDEVEYEKEKIEDDEIYAKVSGEWKWIMPDKQDESADEENNTEEEPASEEHSGEVLGATDENELLHTNNAPAFDSESAYIFFSQLNFPPPLAREKNYCFASDSVLDIAYLIAATM